MAYPAPHPATTDLKPLPVPPLDDTLDAYAHALAAVLAGSELEYAEGLVDKFRTGAGPRLDAQLRERASVREEAGTNWLNDEWYSSYLTTRSPLTLASNVGFQLFFPAVEGAEGFERTAEFIRRAATVHLAAASGGITEETDARGNRITMNQWFVYAGGIRHPEEGEDRIIASQLGAENREIGVFVDGRLFALPVSDGDGAILSTEDLRAGLEEARDRARSGKGAIDFNAPSLLGSGVLAELLPAILERSGNAAVYERLSDMLFTVELQDGSSRSDAERIREATFTPRGAWVYKPLSYLVDLDSDWVSVHVEHSGQDGATLVEAVKRMQDAELPDSPAGTPATPEELTWDLDDATAEQIAAQLDNFRNKAKRFTADIITVPHTAPADLPFKISRDASAQLIMTIAQQLTYGYVRAVYEAVDMREFRAGRTECLRAATPEAVAFAQKLVDATATPSDLQSALDAHRAWVKRCKSGNGFDRHIQMMATIDDSDLFFTDRTVTAARRDFLSTTSIGGADQIVRYCFAPTLPEGFGISYTPLPGDAEFCMSWNTSTAERADKFRASIATASKLFWEFCGEIA